MDARQLFLADHARIHAAATSTEAELALAGGFTMQDDTLKRLEEADLRASPDGLCSIVWHIWHMTRIEDVTANTLLRGQPEVLDRDDWLTRWGSRRGTSGPATPTRRSEGYRRRSTWRRCSRTATPSGARREPGSATWTSTRWTWCRTWRRGSRRPRRSSSERAAWLRAFHRQVGRVPAQLPDQRPRLHALGRGARDAGSARLPGPMTAGVDPMGQAVRCSRRRRLT